MDINESRDEQRRNMDARRREEKVLLRQRVQDKLHLCIMCTPINQMEGNVAKLTEWILSLLGSEGPPPLGPMPTEIFGLQPDQVLKLINYYEAHTGKKAEAL